MSEKAKKVFSFKNPKKFLITTIFFLILGGVTATTVLVIFNSKAEVNTDNFNPNSNFEEWNNYYNKHKKDHKLIDLTNLINFTSDKSNGLTLDITKYESNNKISFKDITEAIDIALQNMSTPLEANSNDESDDILPTNFFKNVNYNPAVNFSIDKIADANNFLFDLPPKYNDTQSYTITMNINKDSASFGIKVPKVKSFNINISVKNEVNIDISTFKKDFHPKKISSTNPNMTIKEVEPLILNHINGVKTQFKDILLSKMVGVTPEQILDNYYTITFPDDKDTTTKDFSKNIPINFEITSNENPLHFSGKLEGIINVSIEIVDLKSEEKLKESMNDFYKNHSDKLNVNVENNKDNDDTKLSKDQINSINQQLSDSIKDTCQTYFNNKYPELEISKDDYKITSDLKVGDNIFNKTQGKKINLTIKSNNSPKFINTLTPDAITIHGHNTLKITGKPWISNNDFKINGIWEPSGKDNDSLQNDDHLYRQDNLLNNWITDEKSLAKTMNKTAYTIDENSFTGDISLDWKLDGYPNIEVKTVNINTDIKSDKVNNFYDLITNTKSIYLETNVEKSADARKVNNVKFNFYSTDSNIGSDNLLYSIDLSDKFNGVAVTDTAKLEFTKFSFNINYQQWS